MNFYDRCYKMTHFSVADYQRTTEEQKKKFQYYDQNTIRVIPDWNDLSPKNESMLSLIHQYLQVFNNDEKLAVAEYKKAKIKARSQMDKYLEQHLYRKLDTSHPETFPEGVSTEEFTEMVKQKSELLYNHIFHMEFVEKHFYWKLENEVYINYLDE